MYGVSLWMLYQLIKTDPTFPYLNAGLKKKYLIDLNEFQTWLQGRTKRERQSNLLLPNADDLLGGHA